MDRSKVGPPLGKIPSGLYIATSTIDGQNVGMLSSFIEQAGFEPPTITIAVQPGRRLADALEQDDAHLGINVLGESCGGQLMKPFFDTEDTDPFVSLGLVENDYGLPQLTEAMAFLACKVTGKLSVGDHIVYAAEVLDGELQDSNDKPMIRVRPNGFSY